MPVIILINIVCADLRRLGFSRRNRSINQQLFLICRSIILQVAIRGGIRGDSALCDVTFGGDDVYHGFSETFLNWRELSIRVYNVQCQSELKLADLLFQH